MVVVVAPLALAIVVPALAVMASVIVMPVRLLLARVAARGMAIVIPRRRAAIVVAAIEAAPVVAAVVVVARHAAAGCRHVFFRAPLPPGVYCSSFQMFHTACLSQRGCGVRRQSAPHAPKGVSKDDRLPSAATR